ncbi:hypothetical protein MMYC01_209130 [Madurella mycetomatis]|uniref:DUF7726 domain-containing protein n=1 Tax=Madurella mycetomatis TaxID=100816 RepID=A0A175VRU9_9PEZI|nr:hypothetical protein MMYC01_209130 [Madurella mycetomatis]
MPATKPRTALAPLPGAINSQPNLASALSSGKKPSKKRKSTENHEPVAPVNLDDIDVESMILDENCDQVRRKINHLIDSGAITKTAFAREIGVSTNSLSNFLRMKGSMAGSGCAAYGASLEYFKKREIADIKVPAKKQKTAAAATAVGGKRRRGATSNAAVDLSDIELDGEEDDEVPVYDTCDEIRRKITAHLKKPGVTQAQLCRDIYAQLKGPCRPKNPFQGSQLASFRGMKGALSNSKSALYYGAYVFFEKLRIKEGKPKSNHRKEMENEWGYAGIRRDIDHRT